MHFATLGFAPDAISCISVTTYFYVYLAGDQIRTMLTGEVCFRELSYSAITLSAQTTELASNDSADSQARRLAPPTMWRISSDSVSTYATRRRTFGGSFSSYARGLGVRTFGGLSSSHARRLGVKRHSAYLRRLV
jgi:hypothetical protein